MRADSVKADEGAHLVLQPAACVELVQLPRMTNSVFYRGIFKFRYQTHERHRFDSTELPVTIRENPSIKNTFQYSQCKKKLLWIDRNQIVT